MNILLFAPALLLAYIAALGFYGTIKQLSICAGLQVIHENLKEMKTRVYAHEFNI